jgi:transcriptional regulator
VLQGTLDLLILKTLETMGPMHGWGIARRLELVSGNLLQMNQGTVYPALLRLEQAGWIRSDWGVSENNRRARFYALTAGGRRRLRGEERNWERMAAVITRVLRSEA